MFYRLTEGPLSQMRHRSGRNGLPWPISSWAHESPGGHGLAAFLQSINDTGCCPGTVREPGPCSRDFAVNLVSLPARCTRRFEVYPRRWVQDRLTDAESVKVFFDEVVTDWIDPTPGRFYLLVNYQNLHIAAQAADDYAQSIRRFQHRLLGTFRYGVPADFTGVAVSLGNMRLKARANLFDDEAAARAAIAHSKQGEGKGCSGRG